ncbi:AAA domain-containing protein [Amycolatopsis orientalis]|nr:AAA domain-containing protein [Amycolatopsis orientalis]
MATRNYPIDDLVTAIRYEVAAILSGSGSDAEKTTLRDGSLLASTDAGYDYVFSAPKWQPAPRNRYLLRPSRSRKQWSRATASLMPDGKIRLTSTTDWGQNPGSMQLRADDTATLELLADRIATIGDDPKSFNTTTASWIFGEGSPRIGRCTEIARLVQGYEKLGLNSRQRLAIDHALGSDITFIWGPPGTGKTDVLSRIIEGSYRQGLRVLFLAPTHVAVDQALERVCELFEHEDQFMSGLVQRNGEIAVPSLERRYGPAIRSSDIAARLTTELTARIDETTARLKNVRAGIELHRQIQTATVERHELEERARQLALTVSEHDLSSRREEQAASDCTARADRLEGQAGMFAGRREEKIRSLRLKASRHLTTAEEVRLLRRAGDQDLLACNAALDLVVQQLQDQLPRLSRIQPLARLRTMERDLTDALTCFEKERMDIAAAVRDHCRVMGATVSKAVQSTALMPAIDLVIIDEAGMVDLPSAWYAAGLAAKRVVLAGDFRQLPPITHGSTSRTATPAERDHSKRWMDQDVFTAAGLVDASGTAKPDSRMICLDSQYRMRPEICAVVNAVAYPDSPLRTLRNDVSRLPDSPLLTGAVVLVDTSARRVPNTRGNYGAHKTNPVHEAVIHEYIRGLQYDTVLPGRKADTAADGDRVTDRLAVIAPYKDQVRSLKASLRYRFGEPYEGLVDTVHRFQGSQRPVVVIDTVAGAGDELGMFYAETGLSSTTCRLLNVALSRAQDHLVVVADVDFLGERLQPGSEAAHMLDHLVRHADRISVDDLVPVREAADLSGLSKEELARPAFFPADEVPRAIEWDIDHAVRSLEIYSPFLDRRAVKRWLGRLAPRLANGIQVTVFTRPPEEETVAVQLAEDLRAAGCEVSYRERMHEKVVIVDGIVLWHGSLNLLANTGPTDLMMRITDVSACERVRRIMTTARRERPLAARRFRSGPSPQVGTAQKVSPGDVIEGRLYLQVPYEERHEAKRTVKAQWDAKLKLWHVDENVALTQVARWLPTTKS